MVVEVQPTEKKQLTTIEGDFLREVKRDDNWCFQHLRGLMTLPESRGKEIAVQSALKWMNECMRPDVREILLSGESEPVYRVWVEPFQLEKDKEPGFVVYWTGLLRHGGMMPATPVVMGRYFNQQEGQEWINIYDLKDKQPKVVYHQLKTRIENQLVDFFLKDELFLGKRKEQENINKMVQHHDDFIAAFKTKKLDIQWGVTIIAGFIGSIPALIMVVIELIKK